MNKQVFNNLCLICAQFQCQQESFHKKYTLQQIQQLLVKLTLLQVSSQGKRKEIKYNSYNSLSFNGRRMNMQCLPFGMSSQTQMKYGNQKFIQKLRDSLRFSAESKHLRSTSLQQVILATISNIYCLQMISKNPLIYHDVCQLIKMIWFNRLSLQQANRQNMSLPFTQSRIKKVISYIQEVIRKKQKQVVKIGQKCNESKSIPKNVFNDLTNIDYTNVNKKNSNSQNSFICPDLVDKNTERTILQETLNKQNFFEKLIQQLRQISKLYPFNTSQKQTKMLDLFTNEISKIQKIYISNLNNWKHNIKINKRKREINQQYQMENTTQYRIKVDPKECTYPRKEYKKVPCEGKNKHSQQPEYTQFTYIQGLPFSTNRRGIDFSMLEITDQVFMNYLPSLQKLRDLEQISLRKNRLTSVSYRLLKNAFPKLRSIDLRENVLDKQTIEVIAQFACLNILYISECRIYPASLIKVCLNLQELNVLYCDRLSLMHHEQDANSLDFRGIFYIMCLNLKKLMFLSVKGYFDKKLVGLLQLKTEHYTEQQSKRLVSQEQYKQLTVFRSIAETLRKRHGFLEI